MREGGSSWALDQNASCYLRYRRHVARSMMPKISIRTQAVTDLSLNGVPFLKRGWCCSETQWSASRAASNRSWEVDSAEADPAGELPMTPEAFEAQVKEGGLLFSHEEDAKLVKQLQLEVFRHKAKSIRELRLSSLGEREVETAMETLQHYTGLQYLGRESGRSGRLSARLLELTKERRPAPSSLLHLPWTRANDQLKTCTFSCCRSARVRLAELESSEQNLLNEGVAKRRSTKKRGPLYSKGRQSRRFPPQARKGSQTPGVKPSRSKVARHGMSQTIAERCGNEWTLRREAGGTVC